MAKKTYINRALEPSLTAAAAEFAAVAILGPRQSGKTTLAMNIAVLYRDELQKADRAMRAFEKVQKAVKNRVATMETPEAQPATAAN